MNLLEKSCVKGFCDIIVPLELSLEAYADETGLTFLCNFLRFFLSFHFRACLWLDNIATMVHGIWYSALLATSIVSFNSATAQQNGADFSVPSQFTNWDNDNWVLSTDQLIQGQYQSRAPMGNG